MLQLLRRNSFNWHHVSGAEPDKTAANADNALCECGEHALNLTLARMRFFAFRWISYIAAI